MPSGGPWAGPGPPSQGPPWDGDLAAARAFMNSQFVERICCYNLCLVYIALLSVAAAAKQCNPTLRTNLLL